MSNRDLIEALKMGEFGDDAAKWAKAFIDTSKQVGWKIEDINEGLMLGWFANAIEVSLITRSQPEWQDISTAVVPYDTPVLIKLPYSGTFEARLIESSSIDSDGNDCDQWIAEHEGIHPEDWTDGACWDENADLEQSEQPTHWMHSPTPPEEK